MERLIIHLLAVGCAAGGESSRASKKSAGFAASSQWGGADPSVVQRDVMNFADRFAGKMAETYDELAARSSSPAAASAALDRKIGNVTAAYVNATAPNPIVGLIDMMVEVRLLRHTWDDPRYAELYGNNAATVVAALDAMEDDIWYIGSRYLTERQLAELRTAIDRWHDNHLGERYVSTVRLADFPEAKSPPPADAKGPASVFGLIFLDPVAGIDPAVREVVRSRESVERMFFYAQRMPILLSWQSDAIARRVLELPSVQQLVASTTRTSDFADAITSIADSVKGLPKTIADERAAAVESLAQKVAVERDATLRQSGELIAAQRDAAIKQVSEAVTAERIEVTRATTQSVASERDAIVTALNASVQSQGQALVSDMETATGRSVNRVAICAVLVMSLGIVLTTLAVLIVRRTPPRTAGPRQHALERAHGGKRGIN